jgi:hypothetical protein
MPKTSKQAMRRRTRRAVELAYSGVPLGEIVRRTRLSPEQVRKILGVRDAS